jgi:maltooligosyltrehalose trehalohydrolase
MSGENTPFNVTRRFPIGAEPGIDGVGFRVWAPDRRNVEVIWESQRAPFPLTSEANGYFFGYVAEARSGDRYRFRLDDSEALVPDPMSRFQPDGPEGPSMVVDPDDFGWTDGDWSGVQPTGQVIYEMHIGTFTREGTWEAARRELAELRRAGMTLLEIMPVHDFCGRFGWGYDGVAFFAPTRLYGKPDDFRSFVDDAHRAGLGVILDVVYNHVGPRGNFLKQFSRDYFSERHKTEWGEAINFDGPNSAPVREFFLSNARYWIQEFHVDGLRLDATQAFFDDSNKHILREIVETSRAAGAGRSTLTIGENEPQNSRLLRSPDENGFGLDGLWNDDFHHSAMVALSGHNEAYYTDYRGTPQEFISCLKRGYLYQGQVYRWQKKPRGTSTAGLEPASFINYLQNHDQIANSGRGWRVHQLSDPALYRVLTALLLLAPQTPLLFQGQEFAASAPFTYFADHQGELAALVKKGRLEFLHQFPSLSAQEMQTELPDPGDLESFARCKLDFSERERHHASYALHKDLLRLRAVEPAFNSQRAGVVDGAVLTEHAFVIRFFNGAEKDRLLVINLALDLTLTQMPEPLLAPPEKMIWSVLWCSEEPRYGGSGARPSEAASGFFIPGKSASVLASAVA